MSHESIRIAILVGLALLANTELATAQEVRIERQPTRPAEAAEVVSYDDWTVSFSRRHAPAIFELDGTHASLASAQAAAARIKAWSNTIQDADWKVAVILLEGSPSYHKTASQGPLTPVDQIMAGATTQIDQLLRTTRTVAKTAGGEVGGKIPNSGLVLGEYRKVVEMSYANVKELQKGLLDLQAKMTEKEFAQVNSLVDQMLAGEAAQFLENQRVGAAKVFMDEEAERSRETGARVSELLDRIARTDDPTEQKRLMEELESVQESGQLRDSIIAEDQSQEARDEHAAAQQHVENIMAILAESKRVQDAIVARARSVRYSDIIGTWVDTRGTKYVVFQADGLAMYFNYATVFGKVKLDGNRISFTTDEGFTGSHGLDFVGEWKGGAIEAKVRYHHSGGTPGAAPTDWSTSPRKLIRQHQD